MSITQYTIFNDTITKKMYNKRNKIVFIFKSIMHAKTLVLQSITKISQKHLPLSILSENHVKKFFAKHRFAIRVYHTRANSYDTLWIYKVTEM